MICVRVPTRRSCWMFAAQGVGSCPASTACSRSQSTTNCGKRCGWCATGSASNPCTTASMHRGSRLRPRSKALLPCSAGRPICNSSALHEWLYYGNSLGGRTLYQGIQQLLPGHYLELDLNSFEHRVCEYHVPSGPRKAPRAADDSTRAADGYAPVGTGSEAPAGQRRAGRGVSVWRCRFERHHGVRFTPL